MYFLANYTLKDKNDYLSYFYSQRVRRRKVNKILYDKYVSPLCFHPFLLFTYNAQVDFRVKCERETWREVRFESWRKMVVTTNNGASGDWWHRDWRCQRWSVAGFVVILENGEQEETIMEVRVCGKSSRQIYLYVDN